MTRTSVPETGVCPSCGRRCVLRCDGTLPDHTPTGDPYAPACTQLRPTTGGK